jgi:chitinase
VRYIRARQVAVAAGTLMTLAGSLAPAASAQPAAHASKPSMVAPYVDTSLAGEYPALYHAITSQHLKDITAGFVIAQGGSCVPMWGGGSAVSNDPGVTTMIKTARRDGAAVIVSFGGANGSELATTCHNTAKLTAAYRSVVKELHVTHLDFDIEGDGLAITSANKRRFAAIHALEAGNHKLAVSLTVPVTPTGLDSLGTSLLREAKHAKAKINLLNVMAMDYGGGKHEMGKTAIRVATDALRQLRHYFPHSTYRNIGITPMIGHNDVYSEVFTTADAHRLVRFARTHHVGRLAFWSLNRDQRCTTPQTTAQFDCSGIAQGSLAFTHIFAR